MMARANKDFERSLAKYVKKVDKVGTKGIRSVALTASKLLMTKSPVDEGVFRANWQVGVNTINRSVDMDAGGNQSKFSVDGSTLSRHNSVIGSVDIGDSINISNSMPYAMRLEHGWSDQASAGMVTVTLIEIKNELDRQNKKV